MSQGFVNIASTPTVPPTVQRFTSGSGTYTTPANVRYIIVKMVGGGGGGGGSGTSGGTPASVDGTNTTFGSSLLTAEGGSRGTINARALASGADATVSAPATPIITATGQRGGSPQQVAFNATVASGTAVGGHGGGSPFGAGGVAGYQGPTGAGTNASANSGGGGGGAGIFSVDGINTYSGSGASAGGYLEALISAPSATYSYTVGTGGAGQGAGPSGSAGGNGAAGIIVVTEYY